MKKRKQSRRNKALATLILALETSAEPMKRGQNLLNNYISRGCPSDEIAYNLAVKGIKFRMEAGKITIVDSSDYNMDNTTILSCMSDIVENIKVRQTYKEAKFNVDVFTLCVFQINYVCRMVGISRWQVLLLSCIIENKGSRGFDVHDLAQAMGMSYIKMLSFDSDLKTLSDKRLINYSGNEIITLANTTVSLIGKNLPYVIPEIKGATTGDVLKAMNEIINERERENIDYDVMLENLDELFRNSHEAGIVKAACELGFHMDNMEEIDRVVFYVLIKRYIYDEDDEVKWSDFDDILEDVSDIVTCCTLFNNQELQLQKLRIVEPCNEDGMASTDKFHLRDEAKAKLFAEAGGVRHTQKISSLKIIQPASIQAKELYYNESEGGQIRRLTNLLTQENYEATCERLKMSGMRTGFTCIFYGGPGTGKTETVYQIAKATSRGIVEVNVNEVKSCWVGESEKLIKGLFDRYRTLVENSPIAPILLFNEADAIFGIRLEGAARSVDKMENSLQNIILQEMERLNGILIATTNLTQNLDKAFERRFLYKVKFTKPETEPKTRIWKSMIPDLSDNQACELARTYDFSGGQIENIARKKMITSIIDGVQPGFDEVRNYCREELIDAMGGEGRRIGY